VKTFKINENGEAEQLSPEELGAVLDELSLKNDGETEGSDAHGEGSGGKRARGDPAIMEVRHDAGLRLAESELQKIAEHLLGGKLGTIKEQLKSSDSEDDDDEEDGGDGYSMEEVAKHTTKGDCWVVVAGQVLNVSNFLGQHPGGELAILTFAGKDATEEFNMIHPPDVIGKYAPDAVIGMLGGGGEADDDDEDDDDDDEVAEGGNFFSKEEVAKHNNAKDCWVILDGKVLNVTSFLKDHPGGELAIVTFAGKDATEEFDMLHDRKVIKKYGISQGTVTHQGKLAK